MGVGPKPGEKPGTMGEKPGLGGLYVTGGLGE